MLVVIDKSAHADPRLEEFLKSSPDNFAVLPEFFGAESYAGNALKNITRSLAILSRFPRQVRLLYGQDTAIRIGNCNPNLRLELIDWKLSRHFPEFCNDIELANSGDTARLRHVDDLGAMAIKFLADFTAWAPEFREYTVSVKKNVRPEVLAALRSDKPYPIEMGLGMYAAMLAFGRFLAREHGKCPQIPDTPAAAKDYFLFRLAVTSFLLIFSRIKDDSVEGLKAEKVRNDVIDAVYATWATYFDGLLTNDNRMAAVYGEARYVIDHVLPYCTSEALVAYFKEHASPDLFKAERQSK